MWSSMVVVVPPVCDHLSFSQLCFAALAACLMFAGQASADVTVSSTEPTLVRSTPTTSKDITVTMLPISTNK